MPAPEPTVAGAWVNRIRLLVVPRFVPENSTVAPASRVRLPIVRVLLAPVVELGVERMYDCPLARWILPTVSVLATAALRPMVLSAPPVKVSVAVSRRRLVFRVAELSSSRTPTGPGKLLV